MNMIKLTPLESLTKRVIPKVKDFKIKEGDLVEMIAGEELGKRGEVLEIMEEANMAIVNSINK